MTLLKESSPAITYYVSDEHAMEALGEHLARAITHAPLLLYLQGDLGAGKTTLTRGILRGFGYQDRVKSPTYSLVETYELPNFHIHHFDLYRIHHPEELLFIGIEDYLQQQQAICLIEWPEQAKELLPIADLVIKIASQEPGRQVKIIANSSVGQTILEHTPHANS